MQCLSLSVIDVSLGKLRGNDDNVKVAHFISACTCILLLHGKIQQMAKKRTRKLARLHF